MRTFCLLLLGCVPDDVPVTETGDPAPADSAIDVDLDGDGVEATDDCDDQDPTVFPGADEHCDGIDQDCDGFIDDGPVDGVPQHRDMDEDGYGNASTRGDVCPGTATWAENGDDCDDSDASIHPGAAELCDDVDADCDGDLDEGTDQVEVWPDEDGDGWGATGEGWMSCSPGWRESTQTGDCDDTDWAIGADYPWYVDSDGDGYGDDTSGDQVLACEATGEYTTSAGGDCDLDDPSISPGGIDLCDDADEIDQNCSGADTEACFVGEIATYVEWSCASTLAGVGSLSSATPCTGCDIVWEASFEGDACVVPGSFTWTLGFDRDNSYVYVFEDETWTATYWGEYDQTDGRLEFGWSGYDYAMLGGAPPPSGGDVWRSLDFWMLLPAF